MNLLESHPLIEIREFESVQSPIFLKYLRASGAYFLMCHDGANARPTFQDRSIQSKTDNEKQSIDYQETHRRIVFRIMIYALINQGYNVALINGLEWADTKVDLKNSPVSIVILGLTLA